MLIDAKPVHPRSAREAPRFEVCNVLAAGQRVVEAITYAGVILGGR